MTDVPLWLFFPGIATRPGWEFRFGKEHYETFHFFPLLQLKLNAKEINAWLLLEFPHEKNHWDHLSIDVDTLSKYWICAGCAIYTFHRCCASVTKVLGLKETPGRTSASNKAMGTLLSFRNRKEEHHSSFPHNLFIKWFQPKWRTPDLQTVGANESVLQSDEDLWAECIDIFCRACCQKKALVSSKDTLGASQYLVSGIIYKAMKSNLSQLKGSGKKKRVFLSLSLFLQTWHDRKGCISNVWQNVHLISNFSLVLYCPRTAKSKAFCV